MSRIVIVILIYQRHKPIDSINCRAVSSRNFTCHSHHPSQLQLSTDSTMQPLSHQPCTPQRAASGFSARFARLACNYTSNAANRSTSNIVYTQWWPHMAEMCRNICESGLSTVLTKWAWNRCGYTNCVLNYCPPSPWKQSPSAHMHRS
jgi:hypothetical protein